MKTPRLILSASLALAALLHTAPAEVFPIAQDAAASPTSGNLKPLSGKAKTLAVSSGSSVLINFAVSSSGIDPATVAGARLVLFLPKASTTGTLSILSLGGAFPENIPASPALPAPGTVNTLATIDLSTGALKQNYLVVDLTTQVKAWLTDPTSEFGVAITSDGTATATLASKEGAALGHPAYIEVDTAPVVGGSANFTGPVGIGTSSPAKQLDVAIAAGTVPAGSSVDSSISLNLVNTTGTGNTSSPNVTGLGFGRDSIRQAIVGGTFGADFLDFYTGGNLLTPKMRIDLGGKVGVGTISPLGLLEVASNVETDVFATAFSAGGDPNFIGRRARGNAAAPLAVQTGDNLAFFGGRGFGATAFSGAARANLIFQAAENWTDANQGTKILFQDTPNGTTTRLSRMLIDQNGNVGIGTVTPASKLQVAGDVMLGTAGQLFAVGAGENLNVVRGAVGGTIATPSVDAGTGFTVARTAGKPVGVYTITFTAAFSGDAIATATTINEGTLLIAAITNYDSNKVEVSTYALNGTLTDAKFMFIATGPK